MKSIRLVAALLAIACACAAAIAFAQITHKPVRIAYFHDERTAAMPDPPRDALRARLKELGYVEGRDYVLEIDAIESGRMDQAAAVADRIVARQPDIFVAAGGFFAQQAKRATQCESCAKRVPVVFGVVVDPTRYLVASYDKPGDGITGVTTFFREQQRQRIEILKQAIPQLERIAILADKPIGEALSKQQADVATGLGVGSRVYLIERNPDLDAVFTAARSENAQAVLVIEQPFTNHNARRIADAAIKHKLPAIFAGDYVDAGGVFTFGATLYDAGWGIADHVDRIIKGAKAGDLPVMTIERRPLAINMKAAREIGLAIPPEMLKKAERVIE